MPPKAEYLILTKEQFIEIKARINELAEKLLSNLQQEGFSKIKSSDDWLGITVEKKEDDLLTFVAFSLYHESPMEFQLDLKKWNIKNPSGTVVQLYERTFNSIEEFESSFEQHIRVLKGLAS